MICVNCETGLEPVMEFDGETTLYQFHNALWLGFFGGYGMFTDNFDNTTEVLSGADYEAVLCHDCAHALCEQNPWMEKLLNPKQGHSHGKKFWEENPDHEGWDKKS